MIRDVGAVGLTSLVLTLVRFEGGDIIVGIALELRERHRHEAAYKAGMDAGIEEGRRLEREAQRKRQANDNPDARNDSKDTEQ